MTRDRCLEQSEGNFNVFCQSCGRVVATNVDSQREALDAEKEHSEDAECRFTGTHIIK